MGEDGYESAECVFEGIQVLRGEFNNLAWNISSNGETVIIWNPDSERCDQISKEAEEKLAALCWYYDEGDNAWAAPSPMV